MGRFHSQTAPATAIDPLQPLGASHIALRPFRLSDIHDLVAAANHPEINRYLRDYFPYPYTIQDAYWWLTEGVKSASRHAAITVDDSCIGGVSVVFGRGESRLAAEIGYWLGRSHWGRGFATEALGLMTEDIFRSTNIERLFAHVFAPNLGSRQVLVKCGYREEGLLRKAILKNNRLVDVYVYARLRDD